MSPVAQGKIHRAQMNVLKAIDIFSLTAVLDSTLLTLLLPADLGMEEPASATFSAYRLHSMTTVVPAV